MTTLNDLVADVETILYGVTANNDVTATLAMAMGTTDTTIATTHGEHLSAGLVEIVSSGGAELMNVTSVDTTALTMTVPSWGRGARGSTAIAHAAGDKVSINPIFPQFLIRQKIDEVINEMYPKIYQVVSDETNTLTANTSEYACPVGTLSVADVRVNTADIGYPASWFPLRRYRYDAVNNVVQILATPLVDRTLRIVARKAVTPFGVNAALSTDLSTTGVPESCRDVLALGAAYKLVSGLPAGATQVQSVEAQNQRKLVSADNLQGVVRTLFGQYTQRLTAEASRLSQSTPVIQHLTY